MDIICLSFATGSALASIYKIYKKSKRNRGIDTIVTERKEKSPIGIFSETRKPLKLPLVRGGDKIKGLRGLSLVIKNKKLVRAIATVRRKRNQLRFLR